MSGAIIPKMGMKETRPSDVLFTKTQRRVLGLLFGNPDRSYYANEIVRFAKAGIGTVQRELERLVAAGLVSATKQGNQKHYQADRKSTVFAELAGLVRKTVGAETRQLVAREAGATYRRRRSGRNRLEISYPKLRDLCRRYHVKKLSLFGSAARGELKPDSDIDLMVVVPDGTPRRQTAQSLYRNVRGLGVAFDVVIATPSLLAKHRDNIGLIYSTILREGREVYAC